MKYISRRIQDICKSRPNLDYGDAMRIASEEYRTGFAEIPDGKPTELIPYVLNDAEDNKLLIDFLRQSMKSGQPLTYNVEGAALKCNYLREWRDLLQIVLTKSPDICSYLGVPNKFKIKIGDRGEVLSYG